VRAERQLDTLSSEEALKIIQDKAKIFSQMN
jgi:hypothetical protein